MMESWLADLIFQQPETEQQRYEKRVAAARAAQERMAQRPTSLAGRALQGVEGLVATPEPQWYDNPEVWDSLSQSEKDQIIDYERRNPVQRTSRLDQMIEGGMAGLGAMFKGSPKPRTEPNSKAPPVGSWRGEVYDRAMVRNMDLQQQKTEMEMQLLGELVKSLEPRRKSQYAQPDVSPPAGFGSATMPSYPEFEGMSWTDPEVQRMMEERRFQQMMALRGRPLNTIPQE